MIRDTTNWFVFVGEELNGNRKIEVYRAFRIHDRFQDERENGYSVQDIRDLVDSISSIVYGDNGVVGELLDYLLIIKRIYTEIPQTLNLFYNTMPRLMLKVYEKIYELQEEFKRCIEYYIHMNEITQVINEIIVILETAKERFHCFWRINPDKAIRIPYNISQNILSTEIFLTENYLPYTIGIETLPKWIDPSIVMMMNEARKIYYTRIQTIARRKELVVPLSLLKMSVDIIKIIIEYTPVDIIFDALPVVLPSDLLGKVKGHSYNNKVVLYVS